MKTNMNWSMGLVLAGAVACSSGAGNGDTAGGAPSVAYQAVIVAPGADCTYGGIRVDMGIDDNRNGQLDPTEVDATEYVCNGAPGAVSLVRTTLEPAGSHCATGGVLIESGIDADGNGVLDPSEVSTSQYVCNGSTPPLTSGPAPLALVFVNDAAAVSGELKSGDYLVANGGHADFFSFSTTASGVLDATVNDPGVYLFLFNSSCLSLPNVADWGPCYIGRASGPNYSPEIPAGTYILMVEGDGAAPWETIPYRLDLRLWSNAGGLAGGVPDPAFGTSGIACAQIGQADEAGRVVVQADGRILVAGSADLDGGGFDVNALVRFDAAGVLDTSFDGDGIATTSGDRLAAAVAQQGDGKIVFAGEIEPSPAHFDVLLWRVNPDGSTDGTFGTSGRVVTDVPDGAAGATAISVQPDGKIVAAGYYDAGQWSVLVARYAADGSLDPTFATAGWVTTPTTVPYFLAKTVAVQPDGKIVVAGAAWDIGGGPPYSAVVLRYGTDGSLDASFDGDGFAAAGTGEPLAISIQADGGMLVASVDYATLRIVRLTANGALDTTFGAGGSVAFSLDATFPSGSSYSVKRVVFAPANRLLIVGYSYSWGPPFVISQGVVARFSLDGKADLGFGDRGRYLVQNAGAVDAVVGGSGEIAVAVGGSGQTCALRLK